MQSGDWIASEYLDNGYYGILDRDNRIIVGIGHELSRDTCEIIAARHNAVVNTLHTWQGVARGIIQRVADVAGVPVLDPVSTDTETALKQEIDALRRDAERWRRLAASPQTALLLGSALDPWDRTIDWKAECDRLADAAGRQGGFR